MRNTLFISFFPKERETDVSQIQEKWVLQIQSQLPDAFFLRCACRAIKIKVFFLIFYSF